MISRPASVATSAPAGNQRVAVLVAGHRSGHAAGQLQHRAPGERDEGVGPAVDDRARARCGRSSVAAYRPAGRSGRRSRTRSARSRDPVSSQRTGITTPIAPGGRPPPRPSPGPPRAVAAVGPDDLGDPARSTRGTERAPGRAREERTQGVATNADRFEDLPRRGRHRRGVNVPSWR